ncbi:hypothetical protein EV421DRAFT_1741713 [Armillaria borealis]|uniref:Uncharacterized protein n=1 Tax=Armillaria borealis TaxID=47425 RepID=A0AA39IZA8_9AGAR|nr:hypothetical protein EV421DRAFT_1741713 [Armillaria borealis]
MSLVGKGQISPGASFLAGLVYSRNPYATCWTAKKDRTVKKIPSLWRRPGESFVPVFIQPVLTHLSSSRGTVVGEHVYLLVASANEAGGTSNSKFARMKIAPMLAAL